MGYILLIDLVFRLVDLLFLECSVVWLIVFLFVFSLQSLAAFVRFTWFLFRHLNNIVTLQLTKMFKPFGDLVGKNLQTFPPIIVEHIIATNSSTWCWFVYEPRNSSMFRQFQDIVSNISLRGGFLVNMG